MEKIDKILLAVSFFLIFLFVFISSSFIERKDFEQLEACSIACKNMSQILKISSRDENGDITCYCETTPGIIDKVKVGDGKR